MRALSPATAGISFASMIAMRTTDDRSVVEDDSASMRELIHHITEDVRTIAHDEVELIRNEAARVAKAAAVEGSVILLGGLVALIGFAMLCVAAVVALEPLVASLAWRLVIMAIVYVVLGGALAATFAIRLRRDAVPNFAVPVHEAKAVLQGVKATVAERGSQAHA